MERKIEILFPSPFGVRIYKYQVHLRQEEHFTLFPSPFGVRIYKYRKRGKKNEI